MKRGELVTVALPGDYGKPRPALVIRSNVFQRISSVAVLPLTSTLTDNPLLRVTIEPNATNGLRTVSQVMVDKPMSKPVEKIGLAFGHLYDSEMAVVNNLLAIFLGLDGESF